MGVVRPEELEWEERPTADGRTVRHAADLTTRLGLTQSRARLWRFPPGAVGRRHRELVQEEVFVVLEGTLTIDLGEPPVRSDVPAGGVAAVPVGTALQLRNAGDADLVLLAYGAPPVTGQAEFLESVE